MCSGRTVSEIARSTRRSSARPAPPAPTSARPACSLSPASARSAAAASSTDGMPARSGSRPTHSTSAFAVK
ncbi:hypothetical protein ACFPRL_06930 [Pseudoclavibacter helvolus]